MIVGIISHEPTEDVALTRLQRIVRSMSPEHGSDVGYLTSGDDGGKLAGIVAVAAVERPAQSRKRAIKGMRGIAVSATLRSRPSVWCRRSRKALRQLTFASVNRSRYRFSPVTDQHSAGLAGWGIARSR